jgi:hypothetical protein
MALTTHPPTPSAKVKERVELYLYLPSGMSYPVLGWNLLLHVLAGRQRLICRNYTAIYFYARHKIIKILQERIVLMSHLKLMEKLQDRLKENSKFLDQLRDQFFTFFFS